MPTREISDAELYTIARDNLALMDVGIPYEALVSMPSRVRQAYVTALQDMTTDCEIAQDIVEAGSGGPVN